MRPHTESISMIRILVPSVIASYNGDKLGINKELWSLCQWWPLCGLRGASANEMFSWNIPVDKHSSVGV